MGLGNKSRVQEPTCGTVVALLTFTADLTQSRKGTFVLASPLAPSSVCGAIQEFFVGTSVMSATDHDVGVRKHFT